MAISTNREQQPATAQYRWFPGHRNQIAHVRSFVAYCLEGCSRVEDAVLLASEVATNAIKHGASGKWHVGFLVGILHEPRRTVRISVHDAGGGDTPTLKLAVPEDEEGGRGLFLVDLIASRWGVTEGLLKQAVWFELDCF
ncbi:ATP-binding protein [Marinactinospora rubrisoli]|uniref:ATP-binding protein n=1 Tax=Marinactinospora rubrisoli TaxID=2715399 RepID=A0ABW2KA52_9ACTN